MCAPLHTVSTAAASATLLHQLRWPSAADCGAVAAEHRVSKGSNGLGNESKVTAPTRQVLGN